MPRLFIAVDLPEVILKQLEPLCCGVPGARWSRAEQLHLTVRFIGEVDGTTADEIADTLAALDGDPFSMRLTGVGHFPPRGAPKILWVGVDKNPALEKLHRQIAAALAPFRLPPERRKFRPHITLARLHNTPPDRVGRYIAENNLFKTDEFPIEEFHLYSSQLNPKGAIYTCEYSYPLARKSKMSYREKWQRGLI